MADFPGWHELRQSAATPSGEPRRTLLTGRPTPRSTTGSPSQLPGRVGASSRALDLAGGRCRPVRRVVDQIVVSWAGSWADAVGHPRRLAPENAIVSGPVLARWLDDSDDSP